MSNAASQARHAPCPVLEVEHAAHERVVPDAFGAPIVVGGLHAVTRATNRDGRDVRALLQSFDGRFYQTGRRRIDAATASDMGEWIDLTSPFHPAPPRRPSSSGCATAC